MKLDRLISIILLLLERQRIGARELADLFEVSSRTIYRDIEAINLAGIPVLSTSGVGGGFEILQTYKIDKKVFSATDLAAILTGLTGLSGMLRGEELAQALTKVRSFIPADRAEDIQLRVDQIHIDLSPWMGARNLQPDLETIKKAMQDRRLLSFEYSDRHGAKTARRAEPYRLVLKGSQWYWQGYCRTREDFRLFKLSRTSQLRLLDETFPPRERPMPVLEVPELPGAVRTEVKLRIHASLMDRVSDYCPSESHTPDGAEHFVVSFPFFENDYHYGLLLSFGDKCECLGPERVRGEMRRRIMELAAVYEARGNRCAFAVDTKRNEPAARLDSDRRGFGPAGGQ